MKTIEARSFAKINWFLRIGVKRTDGFHELETIFQTISLADDLEFTEARAFSIECDRSDVPTDRRNLIWRAWEALAERHDVPPLHVRLRKRIPAGGGLGGGSSNAAVTLRALSKLYDLPLDEADLHAIALRLGSDVPFFLVGGTAHAAGRGEILTALPDIPQQSLLLALPPLGVNTAACFRRLAERREEGEGIVTPPFGLERALQFAHEPAKWWRSGLMTNDLEAPAFDLEPSLRDVKKSLQSSGAELVLMSGSGSTFFAAGVPEGARCVGDFDCVAATTVSRDESQS
jgi:4-diphosphocytidyl-2-C-methyl-D-erythritol kinase